MSEVAPTTVRNAFGLEERLQRSALAAFVESASRLCPGPARGAPAVTPQLGPPVPPEHQDLTLLALAWEMARENPGSRILQVLPEGEVSLSWTDTGSGSICDAASLTSVRCEGGRALALVGAAGEPVEPGAYDAVMLLYVLDRLEAGSTLPLLSACREALKEGGRVLVVGLHPSRSRCYLTRLFQGCEASSRSRLLDCLLSQAGFTVVARQESEGVEIPSKLLAGVGSGSLGEELLRSA